MSRLTLPLLSLPLLAGCAGIQPAHMRLPLPLAEQAAAPMRGFTGWLDGTYSVADYAGHYSRRDGKITFLDSVQKTAGHYRFTMSGPEIGGQLLADCRMGQKELVSSFVNVVTRPLAYRCEFVMDGRAMPARFELQEAQSPVINRFARVGEIALGGETIQFRSVHDLLGARIATSTPVGYVFAQDGVPVGAVELANGPRFMTSASASAGARRTMAVAAVAIALLRDPE